MGKKRHSTGANRRTTASSSGSRNRRGRSSNKGADRRSRERGSRSSSARAKSKAKSKGNRRVDPNEREQASPAKPRGPRDVAEFKARNRTILLLLILAFVNGWIFLWRDEGGLDAFEAKAAVIGGKQRSGFADPMADACGGDPVDIFAGLDDRLRLDTRLNRSKTLRLGLLELGVDVAEVDALEAEVRKTMDLGLLTGSGAPLRVAGDRTGGVQAVEIEVAEGHLVQGCRAGDHFEVRNIQHPLRVDVAVIALELGKDADLLEAVADASQSPDLARVIAATLAQDIDFTADVRPGDRIQVLIEKRYLGRHFHRYGKLLAVRYIGNAGRMAFYRYKPVGADEALFDGDGEPMARALLRTPFAWHPFDAEGRAALAPAIEFVDGRMGAAYRRALGTPVIAVGDGLVRRVGREGDDGLVIEFELDALATKDESGEPSRPIRVRYANLDRTIGELAPGDRVEQGQIIALVGQTGKTPVPRLRLELLDHTGERLDPLALGERGSARAPRAGDPVPAEQLEQFTEDIQSWRRAMRKAGE